jgi:hypothetical protein
VARNRQFRTRTWPQFIRLLIKLFIGFAGVIAFFASLGNWLLIRTNDQFGYHLPHVSYAVPVQFGCGLGLAASVVFGYLLRPKVISERGGAGGRAAEVGGRMWNVPAPDEPVDTGGRHRSSEPLT